MTEIRNGCLADADQVIALQKYALVSAGQNFINSMKVASPHTNYEFIKGRHFACNQGNVCIDNAYVSGGSCFALCHTNFCDTFATQCNNYTLVEPTKHIGCMTISCVGYVCICSGNRFIACNDCHFGSPAKNSTFQYFRKYADEYEFCFTGTACQCCAGTASVVLCFGGNIIECATCTPAGVSSGSAGVALANYKFIRVARTNTYCYLKNGVLQCCVTANMEGSCLPICIVSSSSSCGMTGITFCNLFRSIYCSPPYILTCPFTTNETYPFFTLTTQENTSTGGLIRYNLLCADDNSVLCCNLIPNQMVNVESLDKDTYKLELYNCCICNNCVTTPKEIYGFALVGVTRCP